VPKEPIDVSHLPEEEDLEALASRARLLIANTYSDALPSVLSEQIRLATEAESEDVRYKAGSRIVETFAPRPGRREVVPGTAIQIINNVPIPEVSMIDGKPRQAVEIGQVTIATPTREYKRKVIEAAATTPRRGDWAREPVAEERIVVPKS
jgi:hypothetical protein